MSRPFVWLAQAEIRTILSLSSLSDSSISGGLWYIGGTAIAKMITLRYALQEEDYLQMQLYVASTSFRIGKKRKMARFRLPVIYTALGLILAWQIGLTLALIFFLIALLWLIFYPLWESKKYKRHYLDIIRENHQASIGEITTMVLSEDIIKSACDVGDGTIKTTAIMGTDEIGDYYYARLDKGLAVVFPKDRLAGNATAVDEWLKGVELRNGITRNVNLNWE